MQPRHHMNLRWALVLYWIGSNLYCSCELASTRKGEGEGEGEGGG
jgi:hypothetical protein